MFIDPVDPERDEAPGYFDIVKRPMDLTTVRQRLQNDEYSTFQDWKEDVLLIFANATAYNGKGSPISEMAVELQSLFRDLIKTVVDDDSATWFNELQKLRKDLCEHVKTKSVRMIEHDVTVPKQSVNTAAEVRRFLVNSMTKRELDKLARNLGMLKKEEQMERIIQIIQKGNPEVSFVEGGIIDLNLLGTQTLRELKEFANRELEGGDGRELMSSSLDVKRELIE
jgi:hypothetical protein